MCVKRAGVVVADARSCLKSADLISKVRFQGQAHFMVTAADLELLNWIDIDLRYESTPILLLSDFDTPCFSEILVIRMRLLFDAF